MSNLATYLASFKPPVTTPEKIKSIEKWEKEESDRLARAHIQNAQIPPLYLAANIKNCEREIQDYSRSLSRKPHGLVLRGRVGRGKTYSACAVLLDHADKTIKFATMQRILREIQDTYSTSTRASSVIESYQAPRFLVIDDFGKEQPTKWSLPIMFEIIDRRYTDCKPTIITTQYSGKELLDRLTVDGDSSTAEAIISRMSTYVAVIMDGQNRRSNDRLD